MRYQYTCRDCEIEFEVEGSFDTIVNSNITCPGCRSTNIKKKLFSRIVFKKAITKSNR
jgi:putative FmdB family regulatory protein